MIAKFLLLTLFLIPLVPNLFGFGYESIKVLLFVTLVTLAGAFWLYKRSLRAYALKKPKFRWTGIKISGFIFLICLWASAAMGVNPKTSILGVEPYYQGTLLFSFLFLFAVIISFTKLSLKTVSIALSLTSLVVSTVAVLQFLLIQIFHFNIPTYAGRVISTFGQPNFYSGFLVLTLPFINFLLVDNKLKKPAKFSLLASILAIFISFSRTAIAISGILILIKIISMLSKTARKTVIIFAVLLFLGGGIFMIYFKTGVYEKEIFDPLNDFTMHRDSVERRVFIYPYVFQMIQKKLVFGYGLENMPAEFTKHLKSFRVEDTNLPGYYFSVRDLRVDRSHNLFLDLLFFSGILGLISYLILIFYLFKKKPQKILLITLSIYLLWVQFQNQSIVHLMFFFMLIGLIDRGMLTRLSSSVHTKITLKNQKGFAHLLLLVLLVAGIGLGVYLVGQKTNLFPFAASNPLPCSISSPCTPPPTSTPTPSPSSTTAPTPTPTVSPTPSPIVINPLKTIIGNIDNSKSSKDWSEFRGSSFDKTETYIVGVSDLSKVRPWIGYSDCPSCPKVNTKQQIQLNNLTSDGPLVTLQVYPSFSSSATTTNYRISAVSGIIHEGNNPIMGFSPPGFLDSVKSAYTFEFLPITKSVTLQIENGQTSGANYLYLDAYEVDIAKNGDIGNYEKSNSSKDWDEFLGSGGDKSETHIIGSRDLKTIRPWIGYSDCPSCPKVNTKQQLVLNNLLIGSLYGLRIYPSFVSSIAKYFVTPVNGVASITSGLSFTTSAPGFQNGAAWNIEFTAKTSSVSLEIGNSATSGSNYMYFDSISY